MSDVIAPLHWPDGTPVTPGPDGSLTAEDHIWVFNASTLWTHIDRQLRDRIIQRLREL
ncbi:hypothetical protein [Saccharopolyspora pogona]|uniref:hypothetical protein n=1 Tax=Saccharopolyspora pogona TaxID=333966 RepID=UPI001689E676|nr:hypothetical protein [Saccharopolyspora pogona]